jgi:hypothetical protein
MPKSLKNFAPIEGFENYLVDPYGRIYSTKYKKIMRPKISDGGYLRICFCENRKKVFKAIHRVVAIAFIPNPENKSQVNHRNGIKSDNRVCNLEWSTPQENMQHSWNVGLQPKKQKKYVSLTESDINYIKDVGKTQSKASLARKFNVDRDVITRIVNRVGKYADE